MSEDKTNNVDDPKLYCIKQFHDKYIAGSYWLDNETQLKPSQFVELSDDDALVHMESGLLEPASDVPDDADIVKPGNKAPQASLDQGHAANTEKLKEAEAAKLAEKDAEIEALKAQLAEQKAPAKKAPAKDKSDGEAE